MFNRYTDSKTRCLHELKQSSVGCFNVIYGSSLPNPPKCCKLTYRCFSFLDQFDIQESCSFTFLSRVQGLLFERATVSCKVAQYIKIGNASKNLQYSLKKKTLVPNNSVSDSRLLLPWIRSVPRYFLEQTKQLYVIYLGFHLCLYMVACSQTFCHSIDKKADEVFPKC